MSAYTLTRAQLDAMLRVLEAFLREHAHPVSAHMDKHGGPLPCPLMKDAAEMQAWIGHATRGEQA